MTDRNRACREFWDHAKAAKQSKVRCPTNPVAVISEIKQIGTSVPPGAIGHDANCVDVPRIDRLIRKGINRRTDDTARLSK